MSEQVTQAEQIKKLMANPQQAKQLGEMLGIFSEKFNKNMPNYLKLVQMDVMSEFNKKCEADNVDSGRDDATAVFDQIMQQVHNDLSTHFNGQLAKLKASLDEAKED